MVAAPLPTGPVTFAFTDIEGSTARWERDRAAMQEAVGRHDAILRAAITEHGGYVFKTIGDAFCAAFTRPEDAVAAMLAAQQTLAAEDFSSVDGLRARAAIHTGTAGERDGDYFGPALNRVARLLAIGHGGQILISGVARDLAHDNLPTGATLVDLGLHRLRDLTEAERVWQLDIAGLPNAFPPLRSLDALPNNLPVAPTTFIGREHDIAEVKALLERHRLLTLVGSGGVGKTRLAIQVGAELLERYPDGVWFADLSPISDPELIPSVIAQALGMSQQQGRRVDEAIPQWLQRKKLLLILDNCEHVVETVAALASSIIHTAVDVRILATSRQTLDIGSEVVHRLPSLSLPADATGLTADEALRSDAVLLFVDRAHAADTRFVLTDDNAPIVAEICRRLDGIALAIELAAARVKVLSIPNLAQRLNERFNLLTGRSRDALPRQKTLHALIDWSYDLLNPQEQLLFARLGVFAGGFGLDAATVICGGEGIDALDVLDLLSSLTDKSLVVADTSGAHERYRLLESMREYAREKLVEHGELKSTTRKHAIVYLTLAEDLDSACETTPDVEWKARVEPEMENWRAALRWTFGSDGDRNLGQRLVAALRSVWVTMAASEGHRWILAALETIDDRTPKPVAAKLSLAEAHIAMLAQQYRAALPAAERAMELYAQLADRQGTALAGMFVGAARGFQGEIIEGVALLESALEEFRRLGSTRAIAGALIYLGTFQVSAGNVAASRPFFSEALGIFRSLGAAQPAAHVALNLAEGEFRDGNALRAVSLIGESVAAHRSLKDLDALTFALVNLAAYLVSLDRWDEATVHAREALSLSLERQIISATVWALLHLAAILSLRPNRDHAAALDGCRRAARIVGFVDSRIVELDMRLDFTEEKELARIRTAIDDVLGAEAAAFFEEGRNSSEASIAGEARLGS